MTDAEKQLQAVRELAAKRDARIRELEAHCIRQNRQIAELKGEGNGQANTDG